MAWAPVFSADPLLSPAGHVNPLGYEMARELESETLDPLSGPERLMLFCVASRMDPAIAGLPHRTAELLVMKNLARRDQARLSLTDQGQAALHSLLGGSKNRDDSDASSSVRTPMPPSLALASLIRRRLMALTVAAVSLQSKRRHPVRATACEPPKKKPRRSGAVSPVALKRGPSSDLMPDSTHFRI
jgi:hypothetical protein